MAAIQGTYGVSGLSGTISPLPSTKLQALQVWAEYCDISIRLDSQTGHIVSSKGSGTPCV